MPSNEALDHVALLAEAAAECPEWGGFATYLALRGQGRRPESLAAMDAFLGEAEHWPFSKRLTLLLWLDRESSPGRFDGLLMPQPLWRRLAAPTASEWLACEPDNARANYLYAIYVARTEDGRDPLDYLRKAVRLDPCDQVARKVFIDRVAGSAENAQHELPWHGYLGDAAEDIRDLRDALAMIEGIDHAPSRQSLHAEVHELLDVALAWDAFQRADTGRDFAGWCAEHGGPVSMLS